MREPDQAELRWPSKRDALQWSRSGEEWIGGRRVGLRHASAGRDKDREWNCREQTFDRRAVHGKTSFLLESLQFHADPLVSHDQRVQDVSTADAPPAVEAEMPCVIPKIVKRIQYQQSSTPWTVHSFLLLTSCSIPVFSNLYRVFQNYIPKDHGKLPCRTLLRSLPSRRSTHPGPSCVE